MLLTVDIGNTNIVLGLYEGDTLKTHWRLNTVPGKTADEYAVTVLSLMERAGFSVPGSVTGTIIASVVPAVTHPFVELGENYLDSKVLVVGAGVRTGVRVRVENPREVGADRVVNTAAAHKLYGGPACVVDFGTATTFDAVSAEGDYLGGAIAPGLAIAADALGQRAAQLFRVELTAPPDVIGKSTVQAMQSGLFLGYVALVEGLVNRFRTRLGPEMKVIATGGLGEVIARHTDVLEVVDPWLTLAGLRLIWELNQAS